MLAFHGLRLAYSNGKAAAAGERAPLGSEQD
jgi:hypothetical protein